MKHLVTLLLVASLHFCAFAQGDIEFSITVVNDLNHPAPGLDITAMETSSFKTVNGKTNNAGKANLKLVAGKEWAVSVGEMKKCIYLLSDQKRLSVTNKFFVYNPKDYKRKKLQDPNRSNAKFKVIVQTAKADTDFKPGECMLALTLEEPNGKKVPGINVDLVNVKAGLIYQAITDQEGQAFFVVPNKSNYEIDVNNIRNYSYCDFGDEYTSQTMLLGFAPTIVKETVRNDTIFQQANEQSRPSSERTLVKIFVNGGTKSGARERIFLRELSSGKVYFSVTNDFSYAFFLVPFRQVYLIDMDYQKNIDAIDLTRIDDINTVEKTVNYFLDPRLENPDTYIPTPDRLLLKNFNEFLEKQFTPAPNKPFNLQIRSVLRLHKQSREALFMLTLAGSDNYGNVRLPLNAAFVLDKSGSMFDDNRAEALKRSLLDIGTVLTDADVVSVVLFDDFAWEVQQTTSKHMIGLRKIAENYHPGGSTNILAGLQRGAESIQRNFDKNKSNKIFLMTDGYGDNPPMTITDFVEEKSREGIEFSALGLGSDFNQSLLELIARKGNGTFNHADNSLALSNVLLKEVKNSVGYSAKDLKVEIYHDEKLKFSTLYGYPVNNQTENSVTFEIGKVPHKVNQLAFLKFNLDHPSKELESTPLTVKVSYFDLLKKQPVSFEQQIKLEWTDETQMELLLDQEEKRLYAIAILNQSMKLMAEAYERLDKKAAREALRQGKQQIEEIFPDSKPKQVKELFEQLTEYLQILNHVVTTR